MVFNFTPVPRARSGGSACPKPGRYDEILNSDSELYGGSNVGNLGGVSERAGPRATASITRCCLTVPPLGALVLKRRS